MVSSNIERQSVERKKLLTEGLNYKPPSMLDPLIEKVKKGDYAGATGQLAGVMAGGVIAKGAVKSAPPVATAVKSGVAKAAGAVPFIPRSVRHGLGAKFTPKEITDSLAVVITPGVKGAVPPQKIAANLQGTLHEIFHDDWKLSSNSIINKETSPKAAIGDLLEGMTHADRVKVAAAVGKNIDDLKPIPLEMADALVRKADAPMKAVYTELNDVPLPQVGKRVAATLDNLANETLDTAQAGWLHKLARKAEAETTVGGYAKLKATANIHSSALYDKPTPGAVSDASLSQAAAWKKLGDTLRKDLYQELEIKAHGRPSVTGLAERGRFEAQAWDARDGIYRSYAESIRAQAPADLQGWTSRFGKELIQSMYFPKGAGASTTKKILTRSTPIQDFNRLIQTSLKDAGLKGGPEITVIPAPKYSSSVSGPTARKPSVIDASPAEGTVTPTQPPPNAIVGGLGTYGFSPGAPKPVRGTQKPLPGAIPETEIKLGTTPTFYPGKTPGQGQLFSLSQAAKRLEGVPIGNTISRGQAAMMARKLGVSIDGLEKMLNSVGRKIRP
jgi:hypothetical protein